MAQIESNLEGQGIEFRCPECGEPLCVFLPADGGAVTIMRRRDIPSEDEGDDSGAQLEPDEE